MVTERAEGTGEVTGTRTGYGTGVETGITEVALAHIEEELEKNNNLVQTGAEKFLLETIRTK